MLLAAAPAEARFVAFAAPQKAAEPQSGSAAAPEETPVVTAARLQSGQTICMDGKLDDLAWNEAEPASGFRMWDPERGAPGHESTVFKVAYDPEAVYFAVACAESNPDQITKRLARRDRPTESDEVRICVDPYFDRSTGYYFEVNPLGVQADGYMFGDGEEDSDWDAIWQAETYQDADGWYAEIRVPLSSIRYRADAPSWGLNVFREIHSKGEVDAWTVWDRETAGFVSRFGRVVGIGNIPPPGRSSCFPTRSTARRIRPFPDPRSCTASRTSVSTSSAGSRPTSC